jgi:hypothetical protein
VGTVRAERRRVLPSSFGDLGGEWSLATVSSGGPPHTTCDARFAGDSIRIECQGRQVGGALDVLVGRDSLRGTTTDGVEFSAQRR